MSLLQNTPDKSESPETERRSLRSVRSRKSRQPEVQLSGEMENNNSLLNSSKVTNSARFDPEHLYGESRKRIGLSYWGCGGGKPGKRWGVLFCIALPGYHFPLLWAGYINWGKLFRLLALLKVLSPSTRFLQ